MIRYPLRVLVTCPPMLGSIDDFRVSFEERRTELICPEVIQTLSVDQLVELIPDMDGWIAGDDPVNRTVLQAGRAGRLRAVVKWGVGVDNVDFAAARDIGIPVTNTPGMFGAEVADVAMSYLTALARETFVIDREVRRGGWPKPRGISLGGKTAALVGFGDIGRSLARRMTAADLRVIAYDPAYRAAPGLENVSSAPWPDKLDLADFLVFTCALTPDNRHMLNGPILQRVKRGVRIVNVARGPLIDEAALVRALDDGQVHSAALDVFEEEPLPMQSPLRDMDRCILGSHNGSNTVDAVHRTSTRAIDLLFAALAQPAASR